MKLVSKSVIAGVLAVGLAAAQAAVVAIDAANFNFNAGQITFTEAAIGTVNPSFAPGLYGASGPNAATVGFGSYFIGQSQGTVGAGGDCPTGTAATGCIVGLPTAGLALDLLGGGGARIGEDGAHTASPVLSGTPFLNGSIAMLFSTDQAGVAFDAGFFNAIGSTRVSAYGRNGALLGSITNTATGVQTLLLGTDDGAFQIAGLLISLVAPEEAGFSIDNVRFGAIRPPNGQVPEPGSLALAGLALLGLAAARRRRPGA